jgi:hypothetical protein
MKRSAAAFTIALALGAIILGPQWAQAQDARQEGPREIEKCRTIDEPGSYKLVKNLKAAPGADCLVITASFVTIDLAGFLISATTEGTGSGITKPFGTDLFGITVRNGSVSGFLAPVALLDTLGSTVEGLHVMGSTTASTFAIAVQGIAKGNTVRGGTVGIAIVGTATGNYVVNAGEGIGASAGSTVIGNTVMNNGDGLFVDCPSNVTNNTAVNNIGANLRLIGDGCNNTNNVAP